MDPIEFDPDGVGVNTGTYFGFPFEPERAALVLISAPWDVTVSYGAGTVYAPDALIEASTQLDFYDPLAPGEWRRGIATADVDYGLLECSERLRADAEKVIAHLEGGGSAGDDYAARRIRRIDEGCAAMNESVRSQAERWLGAGKLVGLVGGDHSTSYGMIRALGAHCPEFGVLHVDAHCDLREAYEGFAFSHASVMFNVLRDVPQVVKLVQVGVRDFSEAEANLAAASGGRNVGRAVPAHRRAAAAAGLRQLRHRRALGRELPPHGDARQRRADLQPGRLPAGPAGGFGADDRGVRPGGDGARRRREDRCGHRRPDAVEAVRPDAQVE